MSPQSTAPAFVETLFVLTRLLPAKNMLTIPAPTLISQIDFDALDFLTRRAAQSRYPFPLWQLSPR
jgi:hypothetical protein